MENTSTLRKNSGSPGLHGGPPPVGPGPGDTEEEEELTYTFHGGGSSGGGGSGGSGSITGVNPTGYSGNITMLYDDGNTRTGMMEPGTPVTLDAPRPPPPTS